MLSWSSSRNWFAVVLTGCALVADVAGCGGDNSENLPPGDDSGGDVATVDAPSGGDADAAATHDADAAAKSDGDAGATGDGDAMATGDGDATTMGMGDADAMATGDGDATTMGMGDADAMAKGDGDATTMGMGDADAAATPDADAAATVDADAAATMDADAATADADAAPVMDADAEASAPVCTAGSACTEPTTQAKEVCTGDAGACVNCTDQTDDPACQGAYGGGYICAGGACVPGNCHNSQNTAGGCTAGMAGQICGVSQPNTCGDCITDAQCQNDPYYSTAFGAAGAMCNTTTHRCVTAACAMANQSCAMAPNTNGNGADECCGAVNATCVPGECCTGSQCGGGMTCVNHTCTACLSATGNQFYVDPSGGTDNAHTGSQTCPFKTITKALQFIGTANPGTQVLVLDSGPVSAGETFPIIVPTNVTIMTASGQTGPAVIAPAANKVGFVLNAPLSGLSNLTIDGAANNALSGIAIYGGSALGTTVVQSVTVTGTVGPGVGVGTLNGQTTAGMATIGPGVVVTKSGTTANPEPGILVTSGNVIITGSAAVGAAGHTSINNNTQHGITVTGTGFVTITGNSTAATAVGQAYVDGNNNVVAGLFVAQTPALVTALQTNVVTGLEVTGTSAGNGIRIAGGSYVKLRNSFVLGNAQSGLVIPPGPGGNTILANIDVGTALSPGRNTLQGPLSNLTNPVAGVCLAIVKAGQTLSAAGNIFGVNKDCVTNVGAVLTSGGACQNGVDIGGVGGPGNANTATVTTCTLQ